MMYKKPYIKKHLVWFGIITDKINFFEEEGYYKSVRIAYSYSTTYIEYESNGDENKTLSTNTRILWWN